ncbi:MAG: VWA domain-containing protein [Terriglobales bacterium]
MCRPSLLFFTLALTALSLAAQAPVQFQVTRRLVAVPVTVLNRRGEFVPGLRRQDFQLSVDGRPMPIVALDGPGRGTAAVANLHPWPSSLPVGGINNRPRAAGHGHVVFLFDAEGIPVTALAMLRRQLAQSLAAGLPAGVDVGIFRLAAGVQLVQPFTTNGGQLAAVLGRLLATPQSLATAATGEAEAIDNAVSVPGAELTIPRAGGDPLDAALAAVMKLFAQAQAQMLGPARRNLFYRRLEALRLLAQVLAGVPGHKEVLWFSTDPSGAVGGPSRRISFFIAQAAQIFNAANASLDIINPTGLRTFAKGSGYVAGGPVESPIDRAALGSSQSALAVAEAVADRTGGMVMPDRNDLGTLARQAVLRAGEQYTLYFAPHFPYGPLAQYHRIQVRVLRPGLKIWYRHGYRQRGRNLQAWGRLPANLSVRQWATSPMDFRGLPLALIPGQRTGPMAPYWQDVSDHRPIEELPFTLLIPIARLLHPTPHGDGLYDFSVEVMVTSARSGKTTHLPADHFRSHVDAWRAAALEGTPLRYRGRFVLPVRGACLARVAVRDNVNGALGSVTLLLR